jgi:hypothetical protein
MLDAVLRIAVLEIDQVLFKVPVSQEELSKSQIEEIERIVSRAWRPSSYHEKRGFPERLKLHLKDSNGFKCLDKDKQEFILDQIMDAVQSLPNPRPNDMIAVEGLFERDVRVEEREGPITYQQYYRARCFKTESVKDGKLNVSYEQQADSDNPVMECRVGGYLNPGTKPTVKLNVQSWKAVYVDYSNAKGTMGWVSVGEDGDELLVRAKGYKCENDGGYSENDSVIQWVDPDYEEGEIDSVMIYTTGTTTNQCTVLCLYCPMGENEVILSLAHIGGGNPAYVRLEPMLQGMDVSKVEGVLALPYDPTYDFRQPKPVGSGVLKLLAQAGISLAKITIYQNCQGFDFGMDSSGYWGQLLDLDLLD